MYRTLAGYAVLGIIGLIAVKIVMAMVGFALSVLWTLVWVAAVAFLLYLALRIVSPRTARKVREKVEGQGEPAAE